MRSGRQVFCSCVSEYPAYCVFRHNLNQLIENCFTTELSIFVRNNDGSCMLFVVPNKGEDIRLMDLFTSAAMTAINVIVVVFTFGIGALIIVV